MAICKFLISLGALVSVLLGALGCVWFGFWMLLVFETPAKHPRISLEEKVYIESTIGHHEKKVKNQKQLVK